MQDPKSKFIWCKPEHTNKLYKDSLRIAENRNSILFRDLRINDIHKDSIGYWPSTTEMLQLLEVKLDLPEINNALVVPFYNSDLTIGHLGLIWDKGRGYGVRSIGSTPNGIFNLLNAHRSFNLGEVHDKQKRLRVVDALLPSLNQDNAVHFFFINDTNLKTLSTITRRISLHGSPEFIKRFELIEGFDIKIANTDQTIAEYSTKSFLFSDLLGLDLRAVVPQAIHYANSLPFYERVQFNSEFIKVFKLDLRNIAPWMFEHQLTEKRLYDAVKAVLKEDFMVVPSNSGFSSEGLNINIRHKTNAKPVSLLLNESNLAIYFSRYYGDLIDFCYSRDIGGLPASYLWGADLKTRLPRKETYTYVVSLFYMSILDMLKVQNDRIQ